MTIVLKPGQKRRGYEVVRELNRGAFAISYEAKLPVGEKVFFKQYKSPSRLVDWYHGFVEHQKELKKRIESDPAAKERCYRFIEFFEENDFFQVFEFIDGGKALSDCIAEIDRYKWNQIVIFSKVMMFGIKALHDIRIVHTDLKPDNIILIPDATVGIGYRLRVIDLDWSIFSDKKAPWHGKQGYIGSPFYQSPEHVSGGVPLPASDVFTSGIMLGQLLGEGHPFAHYLKDASLYDKAIKGGDFKPIVIREPIPGIEEPHFLQRVLNACLHPDPKKRPSTAQVCDALLGKTFDMAFDESRSAPKPSAPRPRPKAPPTAAVPARLSPSVATALALSIRGRHVTTVSTDAVLGKATFRAFDADAQFMSVDQFRLYRRDGYWWVEHCADATNETLLNGAALRAAHRLDDEVRIAVGNSSKAIEKCPIQIKLIH